MNSSKKHFKEGDNCCFSVQFFITFAAQCHNLIFAAANYKHIDVAYDVLFMFSAEKKIQVISSKRED